MLMLGTRLGQNNAVDTNAFLAYTSNIMELSKYAKVFKALANEQRLKIFLSIYEQSQKNVEGRKVFSMNESSCCPMEKAFTKMCECINLSPSTISHHFKELQNAGLIVCWREGQAYHCKINEEVVSDIKSFLK